MAADRTALDGVAKDVYESGISEAVNNSFPLKDFFKTEKVQYKGGRGHKWGVHVSRNSSPFFGGELGAFPVAGNQGYAQGEIDMKKLIARVSMSEEAMEDLTSSEASFVNAMTEEKNRLVDDITKQEEFALSTDGKGVYALIDGTTSTTTCTLDAPGNIANDNFGNRFLRTGMVIAAVTPATGQITATGSTGVATITAAASSGASVTTSTALSGAADNDYIVQAANTSVTSINDTSYEKAFWGLPALVDDGTNRDNYFGISRTNVPNLKSYVVGSVGAFSLDAAQRTADVVNEKLGGMIDALVMHHSTRRLYIQLLEADRRYNGSSLQKPDGGTAAFQQGDLTLGEVMVKAIRTIGLDQVYFLDTKRSGFKQYVANPGQWVDRDGSVWVRNGTGSSATHGYEAWYYMRKNYFCTNPGYCARWDGVSGQTLIVVRDE